MKVNPELICDVYRYIEKHSPDRRNLVTAQSWLSTLGSNIEAFDGLFALRDFKEGECICRYEGVIIKSADAFRMPVHLKGYLMRLGPQCYVDTRPCPLIAARYINDCINPAGWNVRFDKQPEADPPCAQVVALRDIKAGEEFFVDYGRWYWAGCSSTIKPVRISFSDLHARRQAVASGELISLQLG
jgi:hypothetical protein